MNTPPRPTPPPAVLTTWTALACSGFLVLLDAPAGLLVPTLLVACGAWAWHRRSSPAPQTRRAEAVPSAPARAAGAPRADRSPLRRPDAAVSDPLPPADLSVLSDRQLCLAWRTSYVRLQRLHYGGDLAGAERVTDQRSRYLDELQRRNPAGFEAWLVAGARAPSDPSRYLRAAPRGQRPSEREPRR